MMRIIRGQEDSFESNASYILILCIQLLCHTRLRREIFARCVYSMMCPFLVNVRTSSLKIAFQLIQIKDVMIQHFVV